MVKYIFLSGILLFLAGCSSLEPKIKEVQVPVMYCPAPIKFERPFLPIEQMTEIQKENPGEVAKHYKATVKILQGYIIEIEEQLKFYEEANKKYELDTNVNKRNNK